MALYLGDVKSNLATSSNTVIPYPARVRGIYYTAGSNVGAITIKDGGSAGSTILVAVTPASGYGNITIPGDGILCSSNVYVALTNVEAVTVFYG
jgi:hypothetical protein